MKRLSLLMITHQRQFKADARSKAIAKQLVARGHEVTLLVVSDNRRIGTRIAREGGLSIVESPDLLWGRLRSGWDPWSLINRIAYLSRITTRFDIVHCFETRPATIYPAILFCRLRNTPLITDWNDWWGRGGIIDEDRPTWYRFLFGAIETYYEEAFRTRASGLTVISTALARRAELLGVQSERIHHLPGGTHPELFPNRSIRECRNRIGVPQVAPVLAYSSLDTHFDLSMVFRALAIVAKRHPDVRIIITGKPPKSQLRLVKSLDLSRHVHMSGMLPIEELPWYLGCADLFVLPYPDKIRNRGRWPNKIGDYLSAGRPTVTNPVGDLVPLIERHGVGLFAAWDPLDFSEKINYLIENPDIRYRLGRNARHIAETTFNWRTLAGRLEDFYYKQLNSDDAFAD